MKKDVPNANEENYNFLFQEPKVNDIYPFELLNIFILITYFRKVIVSQQMWKIQINLSVDWKIWKVDLNI